MAEIKVSADLVPPEFCEGKFVPDLAPFSGGLLAVFSVLRYWYSLSVALYHIPSIHVCIQISPFSKHTSHIGLGPTRRPHLNELPL